MDKLNLGDARQILAMLDGQEVASSRLSRSMAGLLQQEGLLHSRVNGSRCKYRIDAVWRDACRAFLSQQFGLRCSLEDYVGLSSHPMESRAQAVSLVGDSKYRHVSTFHGFLVNSYTPVEATLNGHPFVVHPVEGSMTFISSPERFTIPIDVTVVGVENAENFMHIRQQSRLFHSLLPGKPLLFVSRYPQHALADLRSWLQRIPNPYVHFGDFDLAGIHIFLTEFYASLGNRASFLIPKDVEERLSNGNARLYDQQYSRFRDMKVTDARLQPLVDMIHRYGRGYEQEGYIEAPPDFA